MCVVSELGVGFRSLLLRCYGFLVGVRAASLIESFQESSARGS